MSGVTIKDVAIGVEVTGGILAMKGGSIGFMGEYGISLTKSTAALMRVNIMGNGIGQEGIKLSGGMVDLYKTNIREVHKGMTITEGIVRMFGGEIGFTKDYGVSLNQGGFAFLGGVTIKGNNQGQEGIKLSEGRVDLFKTNIRDVHKGMSVENGVVRMFGGEIGFTKDYGVYLKKGGGVLKNVRMIYTGDNKAADFIKVKGGIVIAKGVNIISTTNNGQGISVNNGGRVWLIGTNLKGVHKGMTITEGSVRMEGGKINFKGEYGVYFTRYKYDIT
nr:hypothetical protein [Bartonella bovis]